MKSGMRDGEVHRNEAFHGYAWVKESDSRVGHRGVRYGSLASLDGPGEMDPCMSKTTRRWVAILHPWTGKVEDETTGS